MGYAIQQPTVSGTWTPVFTGFSADPTVTEAIYTKIGNIVTASLKLTSGTSNATSFTLTLPFNGSNQIQVFTVAATNNGAALTTPARLDIAAASNIATLYTNMAAAAWTAAKGKGVNFVITYQSLS